MQDLYLISKNINWGSSLEARERAFGTKKNESVLGTCQKMHTVIRPSLIFRGCTVRFACFCNRSFFRCATKNSPRHYVFTCRTKPPAKTEKRLQEACESKPKPLLWSLWKHSENVSESCQLKKSLFSPGTDRGICSLPALGPGNGTPVMYRYKFCHNMYVLMRKVDTLWNERA